MLVADVTVGEEDDDAQAADGRRYVERLVDSRGHLGAAAAAQLRDIGDSAADVLRRCRHRLATESSASARSDSRLKLASFV